VTRIAVISGVLAEHDAVSNAAVQQAELIERLPGNMSVSLFTQWTDRKLDFDVHQVSNAWQLMCDESFLDCDLAIFHWAIRYGLFDAVTLLAGRDHPRPIVHFHNCTPVHLVKELDRANIESSIAQIVHTIGLGVPLWTFSEFNRRTLLSWGATEQQISHVPFPVDPPWRRHRARRAPDGRLRLLSVGRLVPAKGVHVLIESLARIDENTRRSITVRIVSSPTFSDAAYRQTLEQRVRELHLGRVVRFVDAPTDAALERLYKESDVVVSTSFHEGLCVPVIEAYAAGCRVIGTDAGNLPFIVVAPDPVVPAGDPDALAAAISGLVDGGDVDDEYFARRERLVDGFSAASAGEALVAAVRRALVET
jgi:glycosyltransferase involved in cell wall biosynthesis